MSNTKAEKDIFLNKRGEKIVKVRPNRKQWKLLKSRAKRKSFIGGRASGKSISLGMKVGAIFNDFPRATFVIAGLTYVQLDSIVVPSLRDALEKMGYYEYDPKVCPWGVYVIGKVPPERWARPYKRPGKKVMQYCMTFINGLTIRFVSQDNPDSHRGLSIEGILIDESATISYEFVKRVLIPALRGNVMAPYHGHPWQFGFFDFSSASWTTEGNWIYDTEEKYKKMLDERSKMTEKQLKAIPPEYLFLESTYHDNQKYLPADYGKMLEDTLDPLEFEVEVLNKRLLKIPNAFYHGFSTTRHSYKISYDYRPNDKGVITWASNDYDLDKPLELSLDFNTDICWLLVCQELGREFRVVNSMYKKPHGTKEQQESNLLIQLADWFCETYQSHQKKDVFIYGDPGGNSTSATTSADNLPFFDQFCNKLKSKGFNIFRRELVSYPKHKDKFILVNYLLGESNERAPKIRMNMINNKAFMIALQNTKVKTDKSFKKDKSSEKSARQREYATDGTDAFDYIVWAKYKNLMPREGWQSTGVIMISR